MNRLQSAIVVGLLCSTAFPASKARTVFLSDKRMEAVRIAPGRSVIISLPARPSKVIVGNQGLFAVQYVEKDLAISAVTAPAHSNLFVYLEGRRFGFDLQTAAQGGDEIVIVRDEVERTIKPRVKE